MTGVHRERRGVGVNGGGNRVDSRFHGNDKGGMTGCGGKDGRAAGKAGEREV